MNPTVPAPETFAAAASRFIKATRERVFAAWTTPADILQWFGPAECRALAAEVDLRMGGAYRLRIQSESYGVVEIHGVFLEVNRPSRLAYTWRWEGPDGLDQDETRVTVEFIERDGSVEVRLTHSGFQKSEAAGNHQYGWTGSLVKLESLLGSVPAVDPCEAASGPFVWNELVTSDVASAGVFYGQLFGWEPALMTQAPMPYTVWKKDGKYCGGLMALPNPQAPPHWLAYVAVENTDKIVEKTKVLGGRLLAGPLDIANVGRIAVLMDPQGAVIGVIQPAG